MDIHNVKKFGNNILAVQSNVVLYQRVRYLPAVTPPPIPINKSWKIKEKKTISRQTSEMKLRYRSIIFPQSVIELDWNPIHQNFHWSSRRICHSSPLSDLYISGPLGTLATNLVRDKQDSLCRSIPNQLPLGRCNV